jgi:hypothetical protein
MSALQTSVELQEQETKIRVLIQASEFAHLWLMYGCVYMNSVPEVVDFNFLLLE